MNEQQQAFAASLETASSAEACLLEAFRILGKPRSLFDVGCGSGHLVRLARSMGVDARGIDLYVEPTPHTAVWDLTKPFGMEGWSKLAPWALPVEWVLCWEVAEHLPESAADTLCATISRMVRAGKILFSAAIPGQGGNGHLNEQPPEYWEAKLTTRRTLAPDTNRSKELSDSFYRVAPDAWWYGQNIKVFDAR